MPDCDSTWNHILLKPTTSSNHHRHPELTNYPSSTGLVPSSNAEHDRADALSSSPRRSGDCGSSGGGVGPGGSTQQVGNTEGSGVTSALLIASENCPEDKESCKSSGSSWLSKMFTCRVLVVLLLVKCLVFSLIIPAHLIPTSSSEYPPPDYGDNAVAGGDSHQSTGDEDGFDNNIMQDDQPLSLTLKKEITNLVETFDIHSHPVTAPEPEAGQEGNGAHENGNGAAAANGEGGNGASDDDDGDSATTAAPEDATPSESESTADADAEAATAGNGESQAASDDDVTQAPDSDSGPVEAEEPAASTNGGNGASCSGGGGDSDLKTVLEKLEGLMDAVKNIDSSIDKMETLVQSTMIDERVYKCVSAISNGNQTQALKYWKQILRYLSTPQKQAAILNKLIQDAYGGNEEHILPVIQFIDHTTHYYGYHTLFKELPKHNHLYKNTAVFTLGHYAKKSCGRNSALFKSLPGAVQNVFADFFTLQNKHNKGYLYYAKRCVAKHYHHCLDVLTKRIDPYVLDGMGNDSEEKKRYHWKLNATDTSVTQFFILNHDKYWTYRLQDLNNSPRFKMEEAGSNAEIEQAHFKLKLHTDDEIMIQVRDSDDYLEEEDFKSDKAEVRLHSFHQADGIPNSPRMFWLANPVTTTTDSVTEPDSCNVDLAAVPSANGNGNGNSK